MYGIMMHMLVILLLALCYISICGDDPSALNVAANAFILLTSPALDTF